MKKLIPSLIFTLISLPLLAADQLVIDQPWSPEAPPSRMMAGFMSLHNPGEHDVVLVDAESPQFDRVEFHTMSMDDGVMRMRRLEQLTIPAGETIELKSGGLHLMLLQPKDHYRTGDSLEVTLVAADKSRIMVNAEVRPRRGTRAH